MAIIYGMARMAAIMASTYRPYLGVGLGPLSVCIFFRNMIFIALGPCFL